MLTRAGVRKIQIAVLARAAEDYLNPDCESRKRDAELFFQNPRCDFLFNPFEEITLPELLEVLKHGERLDK